MIQSLGKYIEKQETLEFVKSFGTIIIDECHHVPAETYRNTITKLASYYQYGLTATPFRKGSDSRLIFIYIGETIANIEQKEQDLQIIRNKGRQYFLDNQPDNFSRILHDYSDERKGFILWKDSLEEILM